MRSRLHARSSDSKMVRDSYGLWLMKVRSNLSRNSSESLSSADSASSPTTAFMAAASRPMAYLAYSWLDTSPWSFRVMPSPMADFMRRDRDGSTLMGG